MIGMDTRYRFLRCLMGMGHAAAITVVGLGVLVTLFLMLGGTFAWIYPIPVSVVLAVAIGAGSDLAQLLVDIEGTHGNPRKRDDTATRLAVG